MKIDVNMFISVFKQMFEMQNNLNITIGRDTINASQQLKDSWIYQYAYAINDELFELINSCDDENAKIEIIDLWHFVISMCHLVNITIDDIIKYNYYSGYDNNKCNIYEVNHHYYDYNDVIMKIWKQLSIIYRSLEWKWWSKVVKEDPSKQFVTVIDRDNIINATYRLFLLLLILSYKHNLCINDIYNIYMKKHKANIERQENDYDVRYKNEDDNLRIIDEIKNDQEKHNECEITKNDTDASRGFKLIINEMNNDDSYAWGVHCNLAMPMHDQGVNIDKANEIATQIMRTFFKYDSSFLVKRYRG